MIENVEASGNNDFTVVNYETREQDIDNDGFVDQLRIVFNVKYPSFKCEFHR